MDVDENVFVRQATSRICGHLDIEVALWECLNYLKNVIPAEMLILAVWNPDISSIRIIARATDSKGTKSDTLIQMSHEAKKHIKRMQERFKASKWLDADIINNPEDDLAMSAIAKKSGLKNTSLMHLILETTDRPLCSLTAFAQDKTKFNQKHAHFLNLIKEPVSIAMSNALKHREVVKLKELLTDDNRYLHHQLLQISGEQIIGADFGLKKTMTMVRQVAAHDSPVLLLGETGVGKDVIANAIHYSSPRRDKPFITVNCGAIPDSLLDSELFGHEKGAFTGALAQKRGRFERADNGTIFLDEIGELPPQAQVRLLRVLQNKEIERVGGTSQIPINIRILAATNKNLEEMVKSGLFRADLWFRLNVFPILVPPIRERKEDVPALVRYFIETKSKELKLPTIPRLSSGALDRLLTYDWPGNVREMGNVIERALILCQGDPLSFDHMELSKQEYKFENSLNKAATIPTLNEVTSRYLRAVLDKTGGKMHGRGGAAELAGIKSSTLRSKMDKLGIEYGRKKKR